MSRGRVVVVGLGPAGPEFLTAEVSRAISCASRSFSRTDHHPSVTVLGDHQSFDHLYEKSETIEEVYEAIVAELLRHAANGEEVLYAVPGSPMVAERTVERLLDPNGPAAASGIQVQVLPAMSFLDIAWSRLGIDPIAAGVRLIDGQRFEIEAAGERGPLLVAQCDDTAVLSSVKLAIERWPDRPVTVLAGLGTAHERVFEVDWENLDRDVDPDHLTSLYIPELVEPVGAELARLEGLVVRLRRDCPWDREQTHRSLTRHLIEEAHEVVEAIECLDGTDSESVDHLEEELGDLLFQVYFHARLAAETGWFNLADVARHVHDKLVDRHPHVFERDSALMGDEQEWMPTTARDVLQGWEERKQAEKGRSFLLEGIPASLPATIYSAKLIGRAASVGVKYDGLDEAIGKLHEEVAELSDTVPHLEKVEPGDQAAIDLFEAELGDVLFAACGIGWTVGVDPEAALRSAARRFAVRVSRLEDQANADGTDLRTADREVLDALWERAKLIDDPRS